MLTNSLELCLRGKLVLLGESGCGKSSLVKVFHKGESGFPNAHLLNTSAELYLKKIAIPDTDAFVELLIFDMPGYEAFSTLTQTLCRDASAFFIVFDVNNAESFSRIGKWLQLMKKSSLSESSSLIGCIHPSFHSCLVGTKNECAKRRCVSYQQAKDAATSLHLEYFECSPATNQDVNLPFYFVANSLFESYDNHIKTLQGM